MSYFHQTNGLIAGEGTTSLTLSDARILFLFGNSHLDDYVSSSALVPCTTNVHNAAMIMSSGFVMSTLNTPGNDFIPSNQDGRWFTPLHAYQYADTVFVFAKKMGGIPNTRTYVAKFHFPDLQFVRVDSMLYNNTNYGYTVFINTSLGFGYAYGLYQPSVLTNNDMYLARFPMNAIHDKWQFYSKDEAKWVDPPSGATSLAQIPGENFSIRLIKNKYVLLTQEAGKTCNYGNKIYAQTSALPYGGFQNYHLLHTLTDSLNGNTPASYGITIHPQFLNNADELLVTYAINGYEPCITTCIGGYVNPDYYRIRALRIGLKRIDASY
jgi:hypothetical protein